MSARGGVRKPAQQQQMPTRNKKAQVVVIPDEDDDEEDVLEYDDDDNGEEEEEVVATLEQQEEEDEEGAAEPALVAATTANEQLAAMCEKLDAMLKVLSRNGPSGAIPSLVPVLNGHSDIKVIELDAEMAGAPNNLQNLEALTIWRPADPMQTFGSRTRYARDCKPSKERQGDLKNVMIQSIQITTYKNNFPCKVAVVIPEIYHARGNRRDGTDKQYAMICMASAMDQRTHEVMIESDFHRSEFFRKYPSYTLDNLSSQGIMYNQQTGVHLVHHGHPVVEFLAADDEAKPMLAKVVAVSGEEHYEIKAAHLKKALRNLERSARENLPNYDINKFYVKFVRPRNLEWNDPAEICDNYTSPDLISAALDKTYRISVSIRIAYLLM